jgi:hypothetical protein
MCIIMTGKKYMYLHKYIYMYLLFIYLDFIRYGAASHCVADPYVKFEYWNLRGGWKLESRGEVYIGDKKEAISVAGRSLSGNL